MNSRLRRIVAAAFAAPLLVLAVAPAASAATTAPAATSAGDGIIVDIGLSLFLEIGDTVLIDGILYVYIGGGQFEPA